MTNFKPEHLPVDTLVSMHQPEPATMRNYLIGFASSVGLTLLAYLMATHHLFNQPVLVIGLAVLALTQFVIQLLYFLHLGQEFSPRLKQIVFLMMVIVVFVVVGGSLWIMNNLNHRVMLTPKQMESYMNKQDNL